MDLLYILAIRTNLVAYNITSHCSNDSGSIQPHSLPLFAVSPFFYEFEFTLNQQHSVYPGVSTVQHLGCKGALHSCCDPQMTNFPFRPLELCVFS